MASGLWVRVGYEVADWWVRADQIIGMEIHKFDNAGGGNRPVTYTIFVMLSHPSDRTNKEPVADELPTLRAAKILMRQLMSVLAAHQNDAGALFVRDGKVTLVGPTDQLP